jgi:hypothetical protein
MLYLLQIFKMLNKKQQKLFIDLFNDLSYEINEMGYTHLEDQMELINEMLDNHFGIYLESHNQLERLTQIIISKQGKLELYRAYVA